MSMLKSVKGQEKASIAKAQFEIFNATPQRAANSHPCTRGSGRAARGSGMWYGTRGSASIGPQCARVVLHVAAAARLQTCSLAHAQSTYDRIGALVYLVGAVARNPPIVRIDCFSSPSRRISCSGNCEPNEAKGCVAKTAAQTGESISNELPFSGRTRTFFIRSQNCYKFLKVAKSVAVFECTLGQSYESQSYHQQFANQSRIFLFFIRVTQCTTHTNCLIAIFYFHFLVAKHCNWRFSRKKPSAHEFTTKKIKCHCYFVICSSSVETSD